MQGDAVRSSYDSAAKAYADHLFDELDGKPLDRHLLNRFVDEFANHGKIIDLGCGPGHIAKYVHDRGGDVIGIDLSPSMIAVARERVPDVPFHEGDMRSLDLRDHSADGLISFYSIVHFTAEALPDVFTEARRVITPDGLFLIAFHIGEESNHVDELFGESVSLDFQFHQPEIVAGALQRSGFRVIERTEREPYPEAEYPSRRCYMLARAV
ncbi:MAG TPA: methyltransferase domain-containing protein [Gemmatimonadaceae bacterium]